MAPAVVARIDGPFSGMIGAQFAPGLKTDDLAECMHARIGAAAGRDANRLARDLRERRFE